MNHTQRISGFFPKIDVGFVRMVEAITERSSLAGVDVHAPAFADELARWPLDAWESLAEDLGFLAPDAKQVATLVQYFRNVSRRGAA